MKARPVDLLDADRAAMLPLPPAVLHVGVAPPDPVGTDSGVTSRLAPQTTPSTARRPKATERPPRRRPGPPQRRGRPARAGVGPPADGHRPSPRDGAGRLRRPRAPGRRTVTRLARTGPTHRASAGGGRQVRPSRGGPGRGRGRPTRQPCGRSRKDRRSSRWCPGAGRASRSRPNRIHDRAALDPRITETASRLADQAAPATTDLEDRVPVRRRPRTARSPPATPPAPSSASVPPASVAARRSTSSTSTTNPPPEASVHAGFRRLVRPETSTATSAPGPTRHRQNPIVADRAWASTPAAKAASGPVRDRNRLGHPPR